PPSLAPYTTTFTLSLHDALPISPPPRTSLPLDLFEELPRDQELHDLVRARADPHEARVAEDRLHREVGRVADPAQDLHRVVHDLDRKSTRLNSSHQIISYAVFCL